jgi:hypothetical protein
MMSCGEVISLTKFDVLGLFVLHKLNVATFNFSVFIEFYIKYYNRK